MKKKRKIELDIFTILHLAELYQEQYLEMGLCLSPEQNDDASFHDFVARIIQHLPGKQANLPKSTLMPLCIIPKLQSLSEIYGDT